MTFEDDLRARLRDLAEAEPPWPDPIGAVRDHSGARVSAAGTSAAGTSAADTSAADTSAADTSAADTSVPDTSDAGTSIPGTLDAATPDAAPKLPLPTGIAPRRRRTWKYLPGTIAAGVLLAAIVGGITYVATRDNVGGGASSGSAAFAGGVNGAPSPGAVNGPAASLPTCGVAPTSTGPLAGITTLSRPGPAVIIGPINNTTKPEDYVQSDLTFTSNGPTMEARPQTVYVVENGMVVGRQDDVSPQDIQQISVVAGYQSIAVRWNVPGCDGTPLPAGNYQIVMVLPYSVAGDETGAQFTIVSPPAVRSFP